MPNIKVIYQWSKGITTPTSSRWGIVTILFTAGFALIAVALSVLGMYGMTAITSETAITLFWLGIGVILFAIFIALIWLFTGHRDTTAEDIKVIRRMLEEDRKQRQTIQASLTILDWILARFGRGK